MGMRVRFVKDTGTDYYNRRLDETYPKYFRKWDEVLVENILEMGPCVNLNLTDGNTILNVPVKSFTKITASTIA